MTTMAHLRPQNFMKCDISDQNEEEVVVFAHAASTPVRVGGGGIVLKYGERRDTVTHLISLDIEQRSIKRPLILDKF
jgi:hypothetical protein